MVGLCWQQGTWQGRCSLQVGYKMCVRFSTAFLKVCAELRGGEEAMARLKGACGRCVLPTPEAPVQVELRHAWVQPSGP